MAAPKQQSDAGAGGFQPIEAPKAIELPTEQVSKDSVLFWIERSKNKNIVVYEAEQKDCAHFNDVVGYWLDIDPEYVAANRKKNKADDREELNFMEKKMAYGYKVAASKVSAEYQLTIVSVPDITMQLITDKAGKPHAVALINGQRCYLRRIYVATKESWYGMPTVLYVTITGVQIDNGAIQAARKDLAKK